MENQSSNTPSYDFLVAAEALAHLRHCYKTASQRISRGQDQFDTSIFENYGSRHAELMRTMDRAYEQKLAQTNEAAKRSI